MPFFGDGVSLFCSHLFVGDPVTSVHYTVGAGRRTAVFCFELLHQRVL